MMSGEVFTDEKIRRYRLMVCLEDVGSNILRIIIFACFEEKYEVIIDSIKGKLPKIDQERIQYMSSPESFDVPLLASIIMRKTSSTDNERLCEMIKKIKKYRNVLIHEPNFSLRKDQFEDQISDLETWYKDCLVEALAVSNKLQDSILSPENLAKVKKAANDLVQLQCKLPSLIQDIKNDETDTLMKRTVNLMLKSCQDEIHGKYEELTRINSLEFLVGKECPVPVKDIFTQIQMYDEIQKTEVVDILDYLENSQKNILIEGAAGFGKTSLAKYLLSKHLEGSFCSREILVIYIPCRDDQFESLDTYLSNLFPSTKFVFGQDFFIYGMSQVNLFFMLDGIDEISEKFETIFKEIKFKLTRQSSRLLCTSRPERVHLFLSLINNYMYIKLKGISIHVRELTIGSYWKLFTGCSTNIPEDILKNIITNLAFTNNSPLFICLITYLIVGCEGKIRIRSKTELMKEITRILENRLKHRLIFAGNLEMDSDFFIEKFLDKLGEISLNTLCEDQHFLSSQDISTLMKLSSSLKIKSDEGLSAFLFTEGKIAGIGGHERESYTYFHNVFQEHLASRAIVNQLYKTKTSFQKAISRVKSPTLLSQVSGMLAISGSLTDSLCCKIIDRNTQLIDTTDLIMMEMKDTPNTEMMLSAISNVVTNLVINVENSDLYKQGLIILGKKCPNLIKISLKIVSSEGLPQLKVIIETLNKKNINIHLEIACFDKLAYPKFPADEINLHLNEKISLSLNGVTITETGVKNLPPMMKDLGIFIKNKEDMEALNLLTKRIMNKTLLLNNALRLFMCEGWNQYAALFEEVDMKIAHLDVCFFHVKPDIYEEEFEFIKKFNPEKISKSSFGFHGKISLSYNDKKKLISSLAVSKVKMNHLVDLSFICFSEYCALYKKCVKELGCEFLPINPTVMDVFNANLDRLIAETMTVRLFGRSSSHFEPLYDQLQEGKIHLETLVININEGFELHALKEKYTLPLVDLIFFVEGKYWYTNIQWLVELIEKFTPKETRETLELTIFLLEATFTMIHTLYEELIKKEIEPKYIFPFAGPAIYQSIKSIKVPFPSCIKIAYYCPPRLEFSHMNYDSSESSMIFPTYMRAEIRNKRGPRTEP